MVQKIHICFNGLRATYETLKGRNLDYKYPTWTEYVDINKL